MNSLSLDLQIQFTYSPIINLCYNALQKKETSLHVFTLLKCNSQMFPNKKLFIFQVKICLLLSRSITKTELQLNLLKHKQLPPQIDFAILQNKSSSTPVHYLMQHEEISPHQKHDSHPIFADYGTYQFSIPINDKGNSIIVKPPRLIFLQIYNSISKQIENTC